MQDNNKHKKIQKANEKQQEMSTKKTNKKAKAQRKKELKIKQKKDQKQKKEQGLEQEVVDIEQQIQQVRQSQYKQGCFQDLIQSNNNQEQIENQSSSAGVNPCKFGKGLLYMLDIKKSYRLFNATPQKCDIHIIDGTVELNGKIYYQIFYVSEQSSLIIFSDIKRVQKSKTSSTIKKKGMNKNMIEISQKIHRNQLLKHEEITEQICTYLHDYESEQNILLYSEQTTIQIKERGNQKNWENLKIDKYVSQGQVCLLVGLKNTGKSTFCEYLLNYSEANKGEICILDLDIGRNRLYPGSVSLSYKNFKSNAVKQDISIWIGEYTPLNMISVYMKAVNQLFSYYKEKYYTSSLIINTMGYLTGVGELLIYEIFNVVKPQTVLLMQSNAKQQQWAVNNILKSILNGSYVQRLYFHLQNGLSVRTSTRVQKYINIYAQQKPAVDRFQPLLTIYPIKSISDLVMLLVTKKMAKLNKPIDLYRNNKIGNLAILQKDQLNMRIIIMGSLWRNGLFLIKGVGFGWNNSIYYDANMYQQQNIEIGLINDGIDFEKTFYQINESKMIELQEILGHRIPYLCQNFKSLGNKGMRNNPGKKIVNKI